MVIMLMILIMVVEPRNATDAKIIDIIDVKSSTNATALTVVPSGKWERKIATRSVCSFPALNELIQIAHNIIDGKRKTGPTIDLIFFINKSLIWWLAISTSAA